MISFQTNNLNTIIQTNKPIIDKPSTEVHNRKHLTYTKASQGIFLLERSSPKNTILKLAQQLVTQEVLEKLAKRLDDSQISISGKNLSDSIDLEIKSNDTAVKELKIYALLNHLNEISSLLPESQKRNLLSQILTNVSETGIVPKLISYSDESHIAHLVSYSVIGTTPLDDGKHGCFIEEKHLHFDIKHNEVVLEDKNIISYFNNKNLLLKDPLSYRLKPDAKHDIYKHYEKSLLTNLYKIETKNHLKKLYENIESAIHDKAKLKEIIMPIVLLISNSLGLETVNLTIVNDHSKYKLQPTALLNKGGFDKSNNTLFVYQKALIEELNTISDLPNDEKRKRLYQSIIKTLIDELVHKKQSQLVETLTTDSKKQAVAPLQIARVLDYKDNFNSYNDANYCLALRGDIDFYSNQPLQKDADSFNEKLLPYFLSAIN